MQRPVSADEDGTKEEKKEAAKEEVKEEVKEEAKEEAKKDTKEDEKRDKKAGDGEEQAAGAEAGEEAAESAMWACADGHDNDKDNEHCVFCGGPRPGAAESLPGADEEWICVACTVANPSFAAACSVCATPNPNPAPAGAAGGGGGGGGGGMWTCEDGHDNDQGNAACVFCGKAKPSPPPVAGGGGAAAAASEGGGGGDGVCLTASNAVVGMQVNVPGTGSHTGAGTLLGWKVSGNRFGDTDGGLSSDGYCRVFFGGRDGSYNLPMSSVTGVGGAGGDKAAAADDGGTLNKATFEGYYFEAVVKDKATLPDVGWMSSRASSKPLPNMNDAVFKNLGFRKAAPGRLGHDIEHSASCTQTKSGLDYTLCGDFLPGDAKTTHDKERETYSDPWGAKGKECEPGTVVGCSLKFVNNDVGEPVARVSFTINGFPFRGCKDHDLPVTHPDEQFYPAITTSSEGGPSVELNMGMPSSKGGKAHQFRPDDMVPSYVDMRERERERERDGERE